MTDLPNSLHDAQQIITALRAEIAKLTAALDAREVSVAEAAKVLLDAANSGLNLFDVDGPNELEGLAIKWSGNRGDGVIQLEIAEEFMRESLRDLAQEPKP